MRKIRMFFSFTAVMVLAVLALSPLSAFCQDEPSLGDAARQARLQKQQKEAQAKDAAGKDPTSKDPASKDPAGKNAQPANATKKTPRIITNEEIPEHVGPAARPAVSAAAYSDVSRTQPSSGGSEAKAQALKSQITAMKEYITSMQSQIDGLNDSIHFASNCVANCVQWNERQLQKQQQVQEMKSQLEDQKKHLEDMQESARQQGFGSSVYDP